MIDAENEVDNGGDGENTLRKVDFDEEEKAAAREGIKDRKSLRDFRVSRKLKNELSSLKATVQLIRAETQGNKRVLEVLVLEEADVAEFKSAGLKYRGSRRLQFIFNLRSGRLRISKRNWLDSPDETYKLQESSSVKLPADAVPLNMDEYFSNLATPQSSKSLQKPHGYDSGISYSPDRANSSRIQVRSDLVAQTRSLNRSAMSQYMIKWAGNGDDQGSGYNPAYRKYLPGNDCTNFASQVLEAGGWPRVGDNKNSPTDTRFWYTTPPSNLIPPKQSETWTGAPSLYQFINSSGRATPVSSVSLLDVGDIIFVGRTTAATIGHTMVVCAKGSQGNIYISQHTTDRYMLPITDSYAMWRQKFPDAQFYTWKLKNIF